MECKFEWNLSSEMASVPGPAYIYGFKVINYLIRLLTRVIVELTRGLRKRTVTSSGAIAVLQIGFLLTMANLR